MELKDFVSTSLVQIVEGIRDAQEKTQDTGAWINPAGSSIPEPKETVEIESGVRVYVHDVEFDVALTVNDRQGAEAGAKVQVFGVQLGGGGEVEYENQSISRLRFTVPVVWPPSTRPDRDKALKDAAAVRTKHRNVNASSWVGRR